MYDRIKRIVEELDWIESLLENNDGQILREYLSAYPDKRDELMKKIKKELTEKSQTLRAHLDLLDDDLLSECEKELT